MIHFFIDMTILAGCCSRHIDFITCTLKSDIDNGSFHIGTELIPVTIALVSDVGCIISGSITTPTIEVATDDKVLCIRRFIITYIICCYTEVPVVPVAYTRGVVGKLQVESSTCWDSVIVRETCPPSCRAVRCTDLGSRSAIGIHVLHVVEVLLTATTVAAYGLVPVALVHLVANQCHVIHRETTIFSSTQLVARRTYI